MDDMLLQGEKKAIRQRMCRKAKVQLCENQKKPLSKRLSQQTKNVLLWSTVYRTQTFPNYLLPGYF